MTAPILQLNGISRSYPGVCAVADVTFGLRGGAITGLAGKNGAGKTTLIKILAGAVTADAGRIRIDGRPVTIASAADATQLGIAVVHQDIADVPDLTVAENIALGLGHPRRFGVLSDWKRLRARAAEHLATLQADIDPRTRNGELSPAQRRLVTIARALAQRARVIVLDEPTANLTDAESEHLHAVLRLLRGQGRAVLLVSHRLEEMLALTDRLIVMRDGRIVGQHATNELTRDTLISTITGGVGTGDAAHRRHALARPATGPAVLDVRGLTRRPVVQEVGLQVRAGEILGIAGLAGAGRTELVRLIAGADRADSGTVTVGGRQLRLKSPRDALAAGIALIPEDRRTQGVVLDFSLRHNVTLSSLEAHRRLPRVAVPHPAAERRSARAAIAELGIAATSYTQQVATLSGGNQQKVVIAKCLQRTAKVLLFDEPTHGVDIEGKEEIYRLMESLAAQGSAVVFISSEFNELIGTCERILVMRSGADRGRTRR